MGVVSSNIGSFYCFFIRLRYPRDTVGNCTSDPIVTAVMDAHPVIKRFPTAVTLTIGLRSMAVSDSHPDKNPTPTCVAFRKGLRSRRRGDEVSEVHVDDAPKR